MIEVGVDSFAAANPSKRPGETSDEGSLEELLERIEYADKVGLDVFGVGEHHRKEFLDSANVVILSAAAARTKRIRLTSAVTVLSAADPVRVFQNFATLDLISKGRAEMVVGRGSFGEAFPLFGFGFEDYDELFSEKIELLLFLSFFVLQVQALLTIAENLQHLLLIEVKYFQYHHHNQHNHHLKEGTLQFDGLVPIYCNTFLHPN